MIKQQIESASRRRSVGIDVDAAALIAAMTVTPDSTRQSLINTTIVDLKAAGIWSKIDRLHIYAAHDEVNSLRDWKVPTRGSIRISSPVFTTDRGFAGNGISSRIDTNFNPSGAGQQYTSTSSSVFVWMQYINTDGIFLGGRMGISDPNYLTLSRDATQKLSIRINTVNANTSTALIGSTKFMSANRSGITHKIYFNGALDSTHTRNETGLGNYNVPVLAYRNNVSYTYEEAQVSAVGFGSSLTDAENASLYAIINAYMTAIGA